MDPKYIVTHDGSYHPDDCTACAILKALPEFRDCRVVRTRNPDVIAKSFIAVDVGGVYDHLERRYDHHQIGFDETWAIIGVEPEYMPLCELPAKNIPMAAAGLTWRHYGYEWIDTVIIPRFPDLANPEGRTALYHSIYAYYLSFVDADDSGMQLGHGPAPMGGALPLHIGALKPSVYADSTLPPRPEFFESASFDAAFDKAVEFAGIGLILAARTMANQLCQARVIEATFAAHTVVPRYLFFDQHVTLSRLFFAAEARHCEPGRVLYVIDQRSDGNYSVLTVPLSPDLPFTQRAPLPEAWAGLRDAELAAASGLPDAVFAHRARFMMVTRTRESAEAAARQCADLFDTECN